MFYTYVLKEYNTGKRYVGITDNLERRLLEHKQGKTNSTRNGKYMLIYHDVLPTRSEAAKREKYLKSGKGRSFLDTMLK